MSAIYNNAISPTNVYGRALTLLRRFAKRGEGLVHLDFGCGYGAIAPEIQRMGLTYVGVDLDHHCVAALSSSGFEAHRLQLTDEDTSVDRLSEVLAGRSLSSVTILDTLEHVSAPLDVMRAIRRLIAVDQVPVILSVPNVTHLENVAKMVVGRFEYTVDGLLDRTHVINFSHDTLERMTRQAGLVEIDRNDTVVPFPDRDLQLDPDALGQESTWFRAIAQLREMAREDALSYQLVRAYLPGPAHDENWFVDPSARVTRPFLSIVMRTTGRDIYVLKDALSCLAGQTDQGFEVLLIGHKLNVDRQVEVEKTVEALPPYLSEKVQFLRVEDGNRTRPLNFGYSRANGQYIVTLDDDDLVFGHYVETFRSIAKNTPGRLLRVRCASQAARKTQVHGGATAAISTGPIIPLYPAFFSFVDHLHDNFTPCMAVAYPREVFHTFRLRFDETLSTAEDYDFMMRAYSLFGIACSDEITCVYRRWQDRANSTVEHAPAEWSANHARIAAKFESMPVILPPGVLAEISARTRNQPLPSHDQMVAVESHWRKKRSLVARIAAGWGRFKRRRFGIR